ncbi:MAG: RluA family pseudouridine synthase [Planctomycetes bacterium]|nr:RluA family pseudouridine synthase [Planctomycetota bacterium]NOG55803.1 RluA family pseudouridine synthase [Planctomycetota bacterium]
MPGKGEEKWDSIEVRALAAFPEATGALVIHRLDSETSGLMVLSLNPNACRALSRQFMNRRIGKTYEALLDGIVEADEGEVNLPLAFDYERRPLQCVDHDNGKPATTLYRVLSRDDEHGRTRVLFRPETGRTHQLRVHAATPVADGGIGCPIVGDTLYGNPDSGPRLMLHANFLAFWEPVTGEWVKFQSECPF